MGLTTWPKRSETSVSLSEMWEFTKQFSGDFRLGTLCRRISPICAGRSRGFSLHVLSVFRKIPLYILSSIPDESETIVVEDDKSPKDEAFEIVKSNVGDKEPDELIIRQFLQPHIRNSRAVAKYIRKQKSGKRMLNYSLPRSRFDSLSKLGFVPYDRSYSLKRKI